MNKSTARKDIPEAPGRRAAAVAQPVPTEPDSPSPSSLCRHWGANTPKFKDIKTEISMTSD